MTKSESIKEIAIALNKAQAEMSGAKKGAVNPFFKSKYANLEEVIRCAKEPLHNNGLSVSQFPTTEDNQAGVTTILMHISGEWLESTLLLACSKQDPQGMGSAITYARRYAYQSVLGIPSEDDDGNSASKAPTYTKPEPTAKPAPKPQPPKITKAAILSAFKAASTLAILESKWQKAQTTEFKEDSEVIAQYNAKKAELTK